MKLRCIHHPAPKLAATRIRFETAACVCLQYVNSFRKAALKQKSYNNDNNYCTPMRAGRQRAYIHRCPCCWCTSIKLLPSQDRISTPISSSNGSSAPSTWLQVCVACVLLCSSSLIRNSKSKATATRDGGNHRHASGELLCCS